MSSLRGRIGRVYGLPPTPAVTRLHMHPHGGVGIGGNTAAFTRLPPGGPPSADRIIAGWQSRIIDATRPLT